MSSLSSRIVGAALLALAAREALSEDPPEPRLAAESLVVRRLSEPGMRHRGYALALALGRAQQRVYSVGADRTLRIWDAKKSAPIGALPIEAALTSVAATADERTLVVGSASGSMYVVDALRPSVRMTIDVSPDVVRVRGEWAFIGMDDEFARVELSNGKVSPVAHGSWGRTSSLDVAETGSTACLVGSKGGAYVVDLGSGVVRRLPSGTEPFTCAAFLDDAGTRVALGCGDQVKELDAAGGPPRPLARSPDRGVRRLAVDRARGRIVWGTTEGEVWAADRELPSRCIGTHFAEVTGIVVSDDGTRVHTTSRDSTIGTWNTDGTTEPMRRHAWAIGSVQASRSSDLIVSSNELGPTIAWFTDRSPPRIAMRRDLAWPSAISGDGTTLAAWTPVSGAQGIHVVDVRSERDSRVLALPGTYAFGLACSPSGDRVFVVGHHANRTKAEGSSPFLAGFDVRSGRRLFTQDCNAVAVRHEAGADTLFTGEEGRIGARDPRTGDLRRAFVAESLRRCFFEQIFVSNDGNVLGGGGTKGSFLVDMASGTVTRCIPERTGAGGYLAFADREGRTAWAGFGSTKVSLVEVATGAVRRSADLGARVRAADVCRDGRLAVGLEDGSIVLVSSDAK